MPAHVVKVRVRRAPLTAQRVPELRELYGLEALPLAPAELAAEVADAPTAVVNALRRVVTDEAQAWALQAPADSGGEATTDRFMLPQFVNQRLALLPLRQTAAAQAAPRLRLALDVENPGLTPLTVYAGDLRVTQGAMPEPLFNPTFVVAVLQPGRRLVVRDIAVVAGRGRGAFQAACRAAYRHLDLEELPRAETHGAVGAAADLSGYRESCLVATPRRHLLTFTLPAAGPDPVEARVLLADAAAAVRDRLHAAGAAVERWAAASDEAAPAGAAAAAARAPRAAGGSAHYTEVRLDNGLVEGILQMPGETHTLGELLRRTVFDTEPALSFAGYSQSPSEDLIEFTLRVPGSPAASLRAALRAAHADFESLRRTALAAPATAADWPGETERR